MAITTEEIANAVFDVIEAYVDDNRDETVVWEDWYDELSRNRWTNKAMDALVAGATRYVIYQVNDRGKSITSRNVESWVKTWVDGEYAMECNSDKGYVRGLKGRALDDLEDAVDDHEQLMDDVEDYWDSIERKDRGGGRSRGRRDRDDDDDDRRDRGRSRDRGGRSSSKRSAVRRRRDEDEQGTDRDAEEDDKRTTEREERRASRASARSSNKDEAPAKTRTIQKPDFDGPDHKLPRPYDAFWMGDRFFQLSLISKMQPTEYHVDGKGIRVSPFVHINRVYNPQKEIRYYAMSQDKTITEEYVPMSREADYILHETLGARRRHRTDEQDPRKVREETTRYEAPVNVPDETATLQRIGSSVGRGNLPEPIGPIALPSREGLLAKGRLAMVRGSHLIQKVRGTVFTVLIGRDPEETARLCSIANANNCSAAADLMKSFNVERDIELFKAFDRRISAELTHELRSRFGVPISIDGFSKYWEDLLKELEKRYGEAMVRGFCQGARHVPATSLTQLSEEVKKQLAMDTLDLSASEYEELSNRIVVVGDDVTYVMIDATYDDIGLALSQAPEVVDPATFENFYTLCALALTDEEVGVRSYLVTRDGVVIEVIESPTLKDTIMVRLESKV